MKISNVIMRWVVMVLLSVRAADAATNDFDKQFEMAHRYKNGWGVEKDVQKSLELFTEAAKAGHIKSQVWLGTMYSGGFVPKDLAKAEQWWRTAAERGDAEAQYALGEFFSDGFQHSPDCNEAIKWLTRAANQGYGRAQSDLANLYFDGKCVPQNYIAGYTWLILAISAGDSNDRRQVPFSIMPESEQKAVIEAGQTVQEAQIKLRRLWELSLTPEQIAEAQRRAAGFHSRKELLR
jgi:TPR repeat protein